MKNIFVLIVTLLLSFHYCYTQPVGKDSLYSGRHCRLVLYNGYEAEGIVESKVNDTVFFKTDIITLKVLLKDIKFVLNPGFGLPETQTEYDSLSSETLEVKADTSDECDLYLDNRSVLTDVELTFLNDSILRTFKDGRVKDISTSETRKIVFKPPAPFGKGFLAGAVIGFAAGFFPFAFTEPHGENWAAGPVFGLVFGLILAVPSGLAGGVIGVLTAQTDTYLFEKGMNSAKSKRIKYIIGKHKK